MSSKNMFAIIKFIGEDDFIGICPSRWLISDEHSYWPPERLKKDVGQLIRERVEPDNTWTIYPINILSRANSIDDARRKLENAKNRKDRLTSNPEDYGRGKRCQYKRPVKCMCQSSSDECNEPNKKLQRILSILPSAPSSVIESRDKTINTPVFESGDFSAYVKEEVDDESSPLLISDEECSIIDSGYLNNSPSLQTCTTSLKTGSTSKSDKNTLELILKNQRYMQLEIRSLKETIDRLVEQNLNGATSNSTAKNQNFGSFPLDDLQSLRCLEEQLVDQEKQVYFVRKLRSFGGSMFQDHTRRVLRYLMNDNLADQLNWLGSREKRKFSDLIICKLIVDAVCEEQSVSRSNVEDVIKTWLRHAKERKNYVKKK